MQLREPETTFRSRLCNFAEWIWRSGGWILCKLERVAPPAGGGASAGMGGALQRNTEACSTRARSPGRGTAGTTVCLTCCDPASILIAYRATLRNLVVLRDGLLANRARSPSTRRASLTVAATPGDSPMRPGWRRPPECRVRWQRLQRSGSKCLPGRTRPECCCRATSSDIPELGDATASSATGNFPAAR